MNNYDKHNYRTTVMKRVLHIILFFLIPLAGFSQFDTKELYIYSRIGFGVGFTDINYRTVLGGNEQGTPRSVKANIGGGLTTEMGLGLKMFNNVYLEPFVSYMFSTSKYTNVGTQVYKVSTNRFNIGISGKYFVTINSKMNLELYGGTSYRVPQDMVVETEFGDESVTFNSNLGVHGGFGTNYKKGNFALNAGLRYRFESYQLNSNQDLPMQFEQINPELTDLKIRGVDIVFSVVYNFQ